MATIFHSANLRYAIALWLATVTALYLAFLFQLEPAQWAGITVWIIFIQVPRMNHSKILWWSFGTISGAIMAVILTMCFPQSPELLLTFLALWLALCSGLAALYRHYKAYGWVLAGYTCAIVTMSAADQPMQIFHLAVTRISCIFVGMASAVFFITALLPYRRHWEGTLHHLQTQWQVTLSQVTQALSLETFRESIRASGKHGSDRLSTLEHTLDATTAETETSRRHSGQARSQVAALFNLLAQSQAIALHLWRQEEAGAETPAHLREMLHRTCQLLTQVHDDLHQPLDPKVLDRLSAQCRELRVELEEWFKAGNSSPSGSITSSHTISERFVLERLGDLLWDLKAGLEDWASMLRGQARYHKSCLATHHEIRSALTCGFRMFVAVITSGLLWYVTDCPMGSQFVMLNAVVCSLLTLQEQPMNLGLAFIKSAASCFAGAYVVTFVILQNVEGFPLMALGLALFLIPAGYVYRHPNLHGGAVVSMLIFYGLSMTANAMVYNISSFLNNGVALFLSACWGFFAFNAIPQVGPVGKVRGIWSAIRKELTQPSQDAGRLAEQEWTSLMFDRLRLLHQYSPRDSASAQPHHVDYQWRICLQIGLRQRRLRALLECGKLNRAAARCVIAALRRSHQLWKNPTSLLRHLRACCNKLAASESTKPGRSTASRHAALVELRELASLVETLNPHPTLHAAAHVLV